MKEKEDPGTTPTNVFGLSNRMNGAIYQDGAPGKGPSLRPAFPRRQRPGSGSSVGTYLPVLILLQVFLH